MPPGARVTDSLVMEVGRDAPRMKTFMQNMAAADREVMLSQIESVKKAREEAEHLRHEVHLPPRRCLPLLLALACLHWLSMERCGSTAHEDEQLSRLVSQGRLTSCCNRDTWLYSVWVGAYALC